MNWRLPHEAIHALRCSGRIPDAEWYGVAQGPLVDFWRRIHDIDARYPELDDDDRRHETIAEALGLLLGAPSGRPALARAAAESRLVDSRPGSGEDRRRVAGDFRALAEIYLKDYVERDAPLLDAAQAADRAMRDHAERALRLAATIADGTVAARDPDRDIERRESEYSGLFDPPPPEFRFSSGAASPAGMATTRIGPEVYGYDLLPARAGAMAEPPVLRAALVEIARIALFVNVTVHDFVGGPLGPDPTLPMELTPSLPAWPPEPLVLRAVLAREVLAEDGGQSSLDAARRLGFQAQYFSGRFFIDDIVALREAATADDWRAFGRPQNIDAERGWIDLAAHRFAGWAEGRSVGPSAVEPHPDPAQFPDGTAG